MAAGPLIEDYFVCVGAQKSGTTWLARVLADHPDVFVTPVKEIHYFDHVRGITEHLSDRKRRSRYRKYHQKLWTQWHRFSDSWQLWPWYRDYMRSPLDDAWYAQLFSHRGSCRMAGELTPEYAIIGEEGFRHIHRLAPQARVLFIMRNPVTRAWSQVLHHCRANGLDATRQPTASLKALVDSERFRALGDYETTLRNLAAVFPPEQVRALFYEDLHQDRTAAMAGICGFLGVRYEQRLFPGLGRRFNISDEIALPDEVRRHLREHYRTIAGAVGARLGRLPESWRKELAV